MLVSWLEHVMGREDDHMRDIFIKNGDDEFRAYTSTELKYLAYSDEAPPGDAYNNPQHYAYFSAGQLRAEEAWVLSVVERLGLECGPSEAAGHRRRSRNWCVGCTECLSLDSCISLCGMRCLYGG